MFRRISPLLRKVKPFSSHQARNFALMQDVLQFDENVTQRYNKLKHEWDFLFLSTVESMYMGIFDSIGIDIESVVDIACGDGSVSRTLNDAFTHRTTEFS